MSESARQELPDTPGIGPASAWEPARADLLEELYRRYGGVLRRGGIGGHVRYWAKKYAWVVIVGGARGVKRGIDVTASAVLLVALAPLFLAVALLVKATDRGPVLYWQTRVGRWGREFPFPKFRSMVPDAEKLRAQLEVLNEHAEGITFKIRRDPRVTWIGRILRKTSIDELPQLWCVLKGEMSLVGPRPPLPGEVARYTLSDRRRLDATPGLTCLWQVSGRGDLPFPRQLALDVQYIESQSLWLDVKILLKTIPAVLLGKGAY
jgi:lipopolysaccharide/colanic/teichoic acid biosynthesis glycosyltransferase